MLDDTAKEKGYALMCVAEPQSDCRIKVIEEVMLCVVPSAIHGICDILITAAGALCCCSCNKATV